MSTGPLLRRQPAGIEARQHQMAATERQSNYDRNVMEPLFEILNLFRDKCVMCFMLHKDEWKYHESDRCRGDLGTNYNDKEYSRFRSSAIKLPSGWCYGCLIYQVCLLIFLIFVVLIVLRGTRDTLMLVGFQIVFGGVLSYGYCIYLLNWTCRVLLSPQILMLRTLYNYARG